MRTTTVIALTLGLLLLAAPVLRAEDEYEDDDDDAAEAGGEDQHVVNLKASNFDTLIKKSKFALVAFTAPWCGHCKTLKPHYAKAATAIKTYNADIIVGQVDATEEADLSKKFGVSGYPSLKWFVDGELAMDYNGGRDEEGIVNWIKKKTGPACSAVEDTAALQKLEDGAAVLVVGFFKAYEGAAFEDFIGVAAKAEDVAFVQTTSADVAAAAGLTAVNTIAMIKNFKAASRQLTPYSGETVTELQAWIKAEKMPLSIEFNPANSDKIFNSGIQMQLILWATAAELEAGAELITLYEGVAAKFKGKLVFVTVNNEGEAHEPVTNFFGLTGAVSPQVSGFYMDKNKKFKLPGAITAESLEAFSQSLLDGTAGAEFKSADVPEPPADKDGDVQLIVGKTVDTLVKDSGKDVLLEVYAPWCGHCKKLDPIYQKLAAAFKGVDSVVIAKMDGTDNEHPDIDVKGYPTILFFPAGEGSKPVLVEEVERTVEGFTAFLKANAKVPFTLSGAGAADAEDEYEEPISAGDDEEGKAGKDEL